jgi:tetratricopeptide (TPR) repeat protein
MDLAELYARAIVWAGTDKLVQMFVAGIGLMVAAAILLALGYLRIVARTLGVLGVLAVMGVLVVLHEQTVVERLAPEIRVTRPKYPDDMRLLLGVALVVVPVGASLVMGAVLVETWRRLRATVPAHLSRGLQLYHQQHYDIALAELNRAVRYAPDHSDAYFHRGRVYQARGDIDRALADFDTALDHDPHNPTAYLYRGRIYTEKGQLDDALDDFERTLALRPNDAETFLHRGICLARKGSISSAILDFQRVLKLTNHTDYTGPATEYLRLYGALVEPPPSGLLASPGPEPEPPGPDWVI